MDNIVIDVKGVETLLKKLDRRKSGGPDNMSACLIKEFALNVGSFVPCITHIFQSSLDASTVPQDWKTAYICPVFKGGNRDEAKNYRPISLTSILSKTLEHIISSSMWHHLETNKLITDNQHGFRKQLNTTTQLLHVTHKALKALDSKDPYYLTSFDFSKAFDKVPHNLLIHKLNKFQFNEQVTKWIKEWLTGRTSRVTINGQISRSFKTTSGVPQGSVLGPLLFIIYINDIPNKVNHSDCRLYADDTLLCSNLKDTNIQSIQEDINSLEQWSKSWCMPFNANKCMLLQINNSDKDPRLYMDGHEIPTSHTLKYLGVTFENNLKWNAHVTNISKKANKTLGILRRCLKGAPQKVKMTAFNSTVMPILEYASQVWSPHTKTLIKELDKVHRKALRWIFQIKRLDSIRNVMETNKVH